MKDIITFYILIAIFHKECNRYNLNINESQLPHTSNDSAKASDLENCDS